MSIFQPVTLVTGASSGIGAALARVFAEQGHEVALVARREPELAAVADAIAAAGNKKPHVISIDLARSDSPARIAHELLARGLEPAIVVNNAGFGLFGPAAELDRAQQLEMIDVNVRTLTDLSLRWIDSLIRHKGGLLNVASLAGFLPGPGMAVYYATKAYVVSFSESLHRELKPKGVRVTVLCPGPVRTEFQRRAGMGEKVPRLLARPAEKVAQEGYEAFMKGRPLVVPGLGNKILASLPRLLPRKLTAGLVEASQRKRRNAKSGEWPRPRPDATK
jgi:short-subunit dehydrogenase